MAIDEIQSNGEGNADQILEENKKIVLRRNTSDDPVTWDQMDNNMEILRSKINELIQKVNQLDS